MVVRAGSGVDIRQEVAPDTQSATTGEASRRLPEAEVAWFSDNRRTGRAGPPIRCGTCHSRDEYGKMHHG